MSLGAPLIEYGPSRRARTVHLVLAALGLLTGLPLLAVGVSRWNFAMRTFGPAVVGRWSAPWIAPGLVLTAIGAIGAIWLLRWSAVSVTVHENGLTLRGRRSSRSLEWAEILSVTISGVRYRTIVGDRSVLVLDLSDGSRIKVADTIVGLPELAATVKHNVYPRLLAEYSRLLKDGQPVAFGSLALRTEGVHKGARLIGWSAIKSAELRDGRLLIYPREKAAPMRTNTGELPNAEICLQLVEHYAAQARPGGAAA